MSYPKPEYWLAVQNDLFEKIQQSRQNCSLHNQNVRLSEIEYCYANKRRNSADVCVWESERSEQVSFLMEEITHLIACTAIFALIEQRNERLYMNNAVYEWLEEATSGNQFWDAVSEEIRIFDLKNPFIRSETSAYLVVKHVKEGIRAYYNSWIKESEGVDA